MSASPASQTLSPVSNSDSSERRRRTSYLLLASAAASEDSLYRRVVNQLALTAGQQTDWNVRLGGMAKHVPPHVFCLLKQAPCDEAALNVLEEWGEQRAQASAGWRVIRQAAAYPLIVLAVSLGVSMLLFHVSAAPAEVLIQVVRDFELQSSSFGQTQHLLFTAQYGPWLLIGLAAAWALLCSTIYVFSFRPAFRQLLYTLPGIGALFEWNDAAIWLSSLGSAVRHHTPLPDALSVLAQDRTNPHFALVSNRVSAKISAGALLSSTLANTRLVPPSCGPLLEWGERRQSLDQALQLLAEVFWNRCQVRAALLARFLPLAIFVVAASTFLFTFYEITTIIVTLLGAFR